MYLVTLYLVANVQYSFAGIIKGLGLQESVVVCTGVIYFCIGIPASWIGATYLAETGLLFGYALCIFTLSAYFGYTLYNADW